MLQGLHWKPSTDALCQAQKTFHDIKMSITFAVNPGLLVLYLRPKI